MVAVYNTFGDVEPARPQRNSKYLLTLGAACTVFAVAAILLVGTWPHPTFSMDKIRSDPTPESNPHGQNPGFDSGVDRMGCIDPAVSHVIKAVDTTQGACRRE